MKLNVGCGTDYREGFVNIDGSNSLPRVDKVMNISGESLLNSFPRGGVDFILAQDILEHFYHWEAVELLNAFLELLRPGGRICVRVPDAAYIIRSFFIPLNRKIVLLFGSQDIPLGLNHEMDRTRRKFPQYFCHKYGWTIASMKKELESIGFTAITSKRVGTNFVTLASKKSHQY